MGEICFRFNPKEGLIPRSLLRNKLMTNEVSLGLIPRSLLRGVSLMVCIVCVQLMYQPAVNDWFTGYEDGTCY